MTLTELIRMPGRALWWGLAIAAIVALLLIWGALTYAGHQRDKAAQAQAGATLAGARGQSAGEAITTIDQNNQNGAAIDARVKGTSDAIVNAPAADRDAATVRGLCDFQSNRRKPECRVLKPGP